MKLNELLKRSTHSAEPYIRTAAWLGLLGHPLFYVIWHDWLPQPYENLTVRLVAAAVCLPLVFLPRWPASWRRWLPLYWHAGLIFVLPFPFVFLAIKNEFSTLWMLSLAAATFMLSFFVHWRSALIVMALGVIGAYEAAEWQGAASVPVETPPEVWVVFAFTLVVGSLLNHQLHRAREAQAQMGRHLRQLAAQNADLQRDRNELLGRFLNNTVIDRLLRFEKTHGLSKALSLMTQHERRFCVMLQADIRNFSQLFSSVDEMVVAKLVAQCFSEITAVGQDMAVIKPVGDCIFLYSDLERSPEEAAQDIFVLACLFVESVERVNQTLAAPQDLSLVFGIAAHGGEVVYGNVASESLIDPTVMGSAVNLTARLEELTKVPQVREATGPNGLILTAQMVELLRRSGLSLQGLKLLDLLALGANVRDFPEVIEVYALDRQQLMAHAALARQEVQARRARRLQMLPPVQRVSQASVECYYEMNGYGPNTTWTVFVQVEGRPIHQVSQTITRRFPQLRPRMMSGEEVWLALSTEDHPGEFDEAEVGAWVLDIVDLVATNPALATKVA